jgi:hypothetical protein
MPNRRGGITVAIRNGQGIEMPWGYWPEALDNSTNPFVGRSGQALDALERIAAPLHALNRSVIERIPGPLAPPEIRLASARRGQQQLAQVRQAVDQIESDLAKWRKDYLVIFDYAKLREKFPAQTFAGRQELRAILRGMNAADRAQALQDETFLIAALEQPAAASGLQQSEYNLIVQIEHEKRHPEHLKTDSDAKLAIEVTRIAEAATEAILSNEITTLGQPVVEGAYTTFANTFPQPQKDTNDDSQKGNGKTANDEFAAAVAELERVGAGH